MTDTRYWARVESILAEVAASAESERHRLLDERCGGDERLRREVESLLQSRRAMSGFLEANVADALRAGASSDEYGDGGVGRQVGSYRLEELIGTGGMGSVYRARRVDGAFDQEVAVKLIRDTLADPDLRRRFRHERQILASLHHPHIARLLDGGVTDDGQPYLAMEFIRGRPITAYCDAERLELGARLDLFDAVCSAVQHAHTNLVVHRDLKPDHILIDEDRHPRLLDFGIAAVIDEDGARGDATVTQHRRFTPQYASPEQLRAQPITTATDVYALGVILYEMLVGRRPYRITGTSSDEDARAICEIPPPLPSRRLDLSSWDDEDTPEAIASARRIDPPRLRRRLRGDLDTIVMTALRKEPERRYASVGALRDDLRRHRRGLPIAARPDTFSYRTATFLRRNRLTVAAAAAVAVVLIGGVIATAWQAREATRGRAEAVAALTTSETVGRFVRSILVAADPREGGPDMTVREALDQAVLRIEDELGAAPAVEARVREAIGQTYRTLGDQDEAEVHLVRAHTLARDVFGESTPEAARIAHELAILRLDQGRFDDAQALVTAALKSRRQSLGPADPATLESRLVLASVCREVERFAEARVHLEAVVAARTKDLGADDPATLVAMNDLSGILRSLDRMDEALVLAEEVYHGQVSALGADHPDTLISANDIGGVLVGLKRMDESLPWLERAADGLAKSYPAGSLDVVIPRRNLADVLGQLGRNEEAVDLGLKVLADAEPSLGGDHYVVGVIRLDLAGWYFALDDIPQASAFARRARDILLPVFGAENGFVRNAEALLAKIDSAAGDDPARLTESPVKPATDD